MLYFKSGSVIFLNVFYWKVSWNLFDSRSKLAVPIGYNGIKFNISNSVEYNLLNNSTKKNLEKGSAKLCSHIQMSYINDDEMPFDESAITSNLTIVIYELNKIMNLLS